VTHRVAVIPFGFGLGDTVNMRPLLRAIIWSRPASQISVLCPDDYQSLLPEGVEAICSIHGVPLWQRPDREAVVARVLQRMSARSAAPVVRGLTAGNWPKTLSVVLYRQGFDEVFNLLEAFSSLRLDDRWTPGPWSLPSGHVIDCMAMFLHAYGIVVPVEQRKPTLPARAHRTEPPTIVLNPNAGSTLKEAPIEFWVELADELARSGRVPIILRGREGNLSLSICCLASRARLIATPSLPTLTNLLSSSNLLVSPDTGVLHVAAALGVPYVGLFGSTDPRFLGPYDADVHDIVLSQVPHKPVCRGCWTAQLLPRAACALGYDPGCLSHLQVGDVLPRIRHKLATPSSQFHTREGIGVNRTGTAEQV
jgi:ADP-heptose:LPS heptosyltransferase